VRASADSLDKLATTRSAGERVGVHAFRRDELIVVNVELAGAPLDTCWLAVREAPSSDAARLRQHWLHG